MISMQKIIFSIFSKSSESKVWNIKVKKNHGFKNRYSKKTGKWTDYQFSGRTSDVINNLINNYKNT